MHFSIRNVTAVLMSLFFWVSSHSGPLTAPVKGELTPVELEFYGAMATYNSYVGTQPEQIRNMIELTIIRVERSRKMVSNSGGTNALKKEIGQAHTMLLSYRHRSRSEKLMSENHLSASQRELRTACSYAQEVPNLIEPWFLQLCKKSAQKHT